MLKHSHEIQRRVFLEQSARRFLGVSTGVSLGMQTGLVPRLDAADTLQGSGSGKQLIYLFMAGGMSHIDTFDLKPRHENQGSTRSIQTSVPGFHVASSMPNLAKHADKLCVVNSLTSTAGDHEKGNYFMHTSYEQRATIRHPGLGAWAQRIHGKINRTMPGSVFIGKESRFHGSGGFFPPEFEPLAIGDPRTGLKHSRRMVQEERFDRRLRMANDLDREFSKRFPAKPIRAHSEMYEDAIRLMGSEDLNAFNIHKEDVITKERYGKDPFGQGCLLARRLIECDVRAVEVSYTGWDTHSNHFTAMPLLCQTMDKAVGALLDDLQVIGKLDNTIVVLTIEFGRTPIPNKNSGRDHYPKAFSSVLAGGGIKGGYCYGRTSSGGEEVEENAVTIPDFNATIARGLGIPLDKELVSSSGRPFTVADHGQPIIDLFA